jgi:hypothetical protein
MIFGDRPLREITEREVRALVDAMMAEHLQLEYKSDRYDQNERGQRESLLDTCMFANAAGGVLLIGITESRGEDNQPSGIPDPKADLGIICANPEAELLAFDARIVACIQDRLPVEAHAVRMQNGRFVLIFRIPHSIRRPHCVRFQGHVYFPSRRDRNRYEMDLREIKEQTLIAASQLQRAEQLMERELGSQNVFGHPSLFIAQLPVFYRDFSVDIKREDVIREIAKFDVSGREQPQYVPPVYTFDGLQRSDNHTTVKLHRNGMLTLTSFLPGGEIRGDNKWQFDIAALDLLIHEFGVRAMQVYRTAQLDSPAILGVEILTRISMEAQWNRGRQNELVAVHEPRRFIFPSMEIDDTTEDISEVIRPICDHVHQMFGLGRSFCFDENGRWSDPRL